ncbi:unnamed protein product [Timema podura]|uniref:Aminopeptidase N-like N-terminal domain-containing protein n=1 Tax=Timema podura TaxID=61482 RepID=A0ABN7PCP2_TIMPD|nr:unnamed protein product [Timema podura]
MCSGKTPSRLNGSAKAGKRFFNMKQLVALSCLLLVLHSVVHGELQIYRLSKAVLPTRYRIDLETHFQDDNFTFYGEVWIDLNVTKATEHLTLHCKYLDIFENSTTLFSLPPNQDSNLDLPVIGSLVCLVYCESSVLDHAVTEVD